MISAINCLRRQIEETQAGNESFFLKFLETPNHPDVFIRRLVSNKSERPKSSQEKWRNEINIELL